MRTMNLIAWMRSAPAAMTIVLFFASALAGAAEPAPEPTPLFSDVERAWKAFWDHLDRGDLIAAKASVLSSRRENFPERVEDARPLLEVARQMKDCGLVAEVTSFGYGQFAYIAQCRKGDQALASVIGVRRDTDGVWRLDASANLPAPVPVPAATELDKLWQSFWQHVAKGDLSGAMPYVHTSKRAVFAGQQIPQENRQGAQALTRCAVDHKPYPLGLGQEEVTYLVHCPEREGTDMPFMRVRRDTDGVWRLLP